MAMNPEPEKLPLAVKIILLCFIILAGVAVQQSLAPERNVWGDPPTALAITVGHKQELRSQFGEYREGRISAQDMLKACLDKVRYAVTGKSALAEYAYALRSQVYLDEGDPQAALAEARKAADRAPLPGRGAVALGDALRALGRDETAAGVYRQALLNPDYVPEYTVEDPMDARTLDALFASGDYETVKDKFYENITIQGKFTRLDIAEPDLPAFRLDGSLPSREIACIFKEADDVRIRRSFKASTDSPIEGYVVTRAQVCGLGLAIQIRGKFITLKVDASSIGTVLVVLEVQETLKITPQP